MVSPDMRDRPLIERGLTAEQVRLNRQRYGSNSLTPPQSKPWWHLYLEKFADPVIRILMIAAIIALGIGIFQDEYAEALGILMAIFLATTLAFFNEYKANQAFELLNHVYDQTPIKVIRDGKFAQIPRQDLVVGDIVFVEQGEEVPADGELLEAVALLVDQSKITGESNPIKKLAKTSGYFDISHNGTYPPFHLHRSTIVAQGHGVFEVTAVGDRSEIGQLAQAVISIEDGQLTPLNLQLEKLSQLIGIVGLLIASLTFFSLLLRGLWTEEINLISSQIYLLFLLIISGIIALIPVWLPILEDGLNALNISFNFSHFLPNNSLTQWLMSLGLGILLLMAGVAVSYLGGWNIPLGTIWLPKQVGISLLNYFMIAVTIIVVAVPEGLAMSVTLSLAYSMKKMAATNNLVRRMHACETIGAATVICSDKTGTLTQNKMQIESVNFPCLNCSDPQQKEVYQNLIFESICANSTVDLERKADNIVNPIGNVTEGALLLWLENQDIDYLTYRQNFNLQSRIPFSADNKYMATAGKSAVIDENIIYVKGAPEIVLSKCSHQLTEAGINKLDSINSCLETIHEYQKRGMRVLGFAYHSLEIEPTEKIIDNLDYDLTWLGFVAITDPLRLDVKAAIQSCLSSGIKIKIVTGDSQKTAEEIARQINLYSLEERENNPQLHLTGYEFNQLNDQEAKEVIKTLKVLSRATPLDKLRLVKLLQENGEVVAVTGDGTNDAAALKQAQVGLSMGSGTAIAKEASDMILLDDSFSSIVTAVMWGRSLYENIQRFLVFQLTINIVALGIAFLGPFIGINLPLTVTQMLWINLIMDTFAALALATEPPHKSVMNKPPRHPQDFIISPKMFKIIVGTGLIFLLFLMGFLAYLQADGIVNDYELSVFFAVFVFLQLWNLFNTRCFGLKQWFGSGIGKNKAFLGIVAVIFLGQIAIIQWGGKVFRTVPLSLQDWLWIIVGTSVVLWVGELWRFQLRMKDLTMMKP
ncbi:calcium-translocating P-type ATPase, PMCA-type [Crocosphaera sp. XPORK-15E]|uniref:calcium-translocating P-type ATPase, PMCA-type n=1 Tax=Crocosphaera sp. XPORK-15E TaxID=3110247 RepID=UPI002B206700|nr:calcium-translocating P-type ATPase, PMCA-type [Crocosphaera sp. XPORK-15E]MEA5534553.1 calcium-translocating P-type ATPase, PMCA-type [Crocosphaera sp. XPORK-15E]